MTAYLAVIFANLIWGAASPIFKYALTDMPPFTLAFMRFFFAGLLFLPFILKSMHRIKGKHLTHVILGGIWGVTVNVSFFFMGLNMASSINAPLIGALGPLILYVLSLFILKEKPHPQIVKGMLFAFVGVLIIIFAPLLRSNSTQASEYSIASQVTGNIFFVLAMLGATFHVIHTKKIAAKVDPITITGIQFLVGAITFIPFMTSELQTWSFVSLTQRSWVGIIYGIFFSSALGYVTHNYAIKKLPAQKVGIFSYMMPVVAVLVAIPLLGEYPDLFFIIGSVCVVIGIFISERNPHLKKIQKKLHEK